MLRRALNSSYKLFNTPTQTFPTSIRNSSSILNKSNIRSSPFLTMATKQDEVTVAMCQILVGAEKEKNLMKAAEAVEKAVGKGAQIVSLPECFNSPYATDMFPKYAEIIPAKTSELVKETSPSTVALSEMAKKNNCFLIGGSIPEKCQDGEGKEKIFNTCVIFNPAGEIIAKHRKMHLFDIDIPGGITFKESDTLTAGDSVTTFETPYGRVGVAICYDMRFPQLAMLMRNEGCSLIVYPGAFNCTTGPPHWELLQRGRAVDNQLYVATASPARDTSDSDGYKAWGHSTIISPWGDVMATTEHGEDIVVATLDMKRVMEIRTNIPISKQKRTDIYNEVSLCQ